MCLEEASRLKCPALKALKGSCRLETLAATCSVSTKEDNFQRSLQAQHITLNIVLRTILILKPYKVNDIILIVPIVCRHIGTALKKEAY